MIVRPTSLPGVLRIDWRPHHDDRGFFARVFCSEELAAHGMPVTFEQSSLSSNIRKGTLRGMHFQADPHAEAKLVRCVRGSVFDVAIDLREGSSTMGRWIGETLSADNGVALYVPPGFAHGFQTLEDGSDVLYQITPSFRPGLGQGVRWNDPAFGIKWPIASAILSERDANYPDWTP